MQITPQQQPYIYYNDTHYQSSPTQWQHMGNDPSDPPSSLPLYLSANPLRRHMLTLSQSAPPLHTHPPQQTQRSLNRVKMAACGWGGCIFQLFGCFRRRKHTLSNLTRKEKRKAPHKIIYPGPSPWRPFTSWFTRYPGPKTSLMTGIYKKEALCDWDFPWMSWRFIQRLLSKYVEYFVPPAGAQGWTFGSKNNEARLTGDTMRVGGWGGEKRGNCDKFMLLHIK